MKDKLLIELVRKHRELYDISHPKYMDTVWKNDVWEKIARKMKKSDVICRKRWASIRDSYRKYFKRTVITTEPVLKKKYKYSSELTFLNYTFEDIIAKIDVKNDSLESDAKTIEKQDESRNDESICNEKSHNVKKVDETCKKTNSKEESTSTSTSIEKKNEKEIQNDKVDLFLNGIGATMKTFSAYYQNLAKTKIFTAVQDLELEMIFNQERVQSRVPSPTFSTTSSSNSSHIDIGLEQINTPTTCGAKSEYASLNAFII